MNRILSVFVIVPALLAVGCETTRSVGYSDGFVTSSPVSYSFAAPPALTDMQGRTYCLRVDGEAQSGSVATFERHGMKRTGGAADVDVDITLQAMQQSEPGAVKVGNGYYPAFTVTVPFQVTMRRGAEQLSRTSGKYENMLTFKGGQRFESREQAVAAIDLIRKLGEKGLTEKSRAAAAQQAQQHAAEVSARLFEPRDIALEVPVVRSAAGVDLQQPYELLRNAEGPEQVRQALAAYEQLGTAHLNADGSPNRTANYGVACGIAACRLMLRDLSGAWQASKEAQQFEAQGEEAQRICFVIYQQEKSTGERVIPEADRAELAKQENLAGALQNLFGAPAR